SAVGEKTAQRVAAATGHADAIDVEDVAPAGRYLWHTDTGPLQQTVVDARDLPPPRVPLGKLAQLDPQDRGLDLSAPCVVSDHRVVVSGGLPVPAQPPK